MAVRNEDKIVEAAKQVFLRYGFKRVTMGDIAEAAGISRPALYLVFPSKEEILTAVVSRVFAAALDEIREGLTRYEPSEDKLKFAFEVWCVRPFEMFQQSPDAKDLYESSFQFATEVTTKAVSDFEALLSNIIQSQRVKQTGPDLSSVQIAHILSSATPGFKGVAKDSEQLRELIAGLIAILLAGLEGQSAPAKKRKKNRRRK